MSREKPNTSMFSLIRDGVTDFGITTLPSWRCQRSTTWAGVRPCFWAIATIAGMSRMPLPEPSGDQASVAMPCSACTSRAACCWRCGCSSIWLTAGITEVSAVSRSRCSGRKFDTPMARTRPSASSFSNAL